MPFCVDTACVVSMRFFAPAWAIRLRMIQGAMLGHVLLRLVLDAVLRPRGDSLCDACTFLALNLCHSDDAGRFSQQIGVAQSTLRGLENGGKENEKGEREPSP